MDLLELMRQRHSVRGYLTNPVEPDKLQQILEAARWAPTAANRQAFKVVVAPTRGRDADLKRIYNHDWLVQAPVLLTVCSIPQKSWVRRDGKNYADVDAAIVMDHIILAATALGLGTCWIGAFDASAARQVLQLEEGWEPVVMTPLGYAQDSTFNKLRKPLEDLVV